MSTFGRIQMGLRSLQAHNKAIDTVGHNIANANTAGYSRQRVELVTGSPYALPGLHQFAQGQMGTGVDVAKIVQIRDYCLDRQIRQELSHLGQWNQSRSILSRLELLINEPSEGGLAAVMDAFFVSLEKLSLQPESIAVRETVRQQANILTSSFNSLYQQLEGYRQDINHVINARTDEINTIAHRIADLNKQICTIIRNNEIPNDLMDKRQLLVEELSELVAIRVNDNGRGSWNITISGIHLVQEDMVQEVESFMDINNDNLYGLRWSENGLPFEATGGAFAALIEGRDVIIKGFKEDLDLLAGTLIEEFNHIHREGYGLDDSTDIPFFSGTGAGDIALTDEIQENLRLIAASMHPDSPGDADNIFRLLELKDKGFLENGNASFDDFYRSIVSRLGVMGQKATRMGNNQRYLIDGLQAQQDSIAGVNLDEEMGNLILYQHAYSAASYYINKADEMIQTLLNMIR